MASKKTPIEKLADAVNGIMLEYTDNVQANLDIITKKMGQKGATALRQASRATFGGTGKYAKGWRYATRETRRYTKTTIFNDHFSMPHLLENDHVVRNGTQRNAVLSIYEGRKHIEPIANELESTYVGEVISKL